MTHPTWFDPELYLAVYDDVRKAGVDPWSRYLAYGYEEGRKPSGASDDFEFDGLRTAVNLPGDFVEFGVNYGMLASGGMLDLDWNARNKSFFLFDSFGGMNPAHLLADQELTRANRDALSSGRYVSDEMEVRANFAEFRNVKFSPDLSPTHWTS
ncbi:TylF/MycF/NovP-related O-methyltransferase [Yoonia tamlensis]|uniref:TylF/MycF/NovP-related O-methyltransferase n=1 Tax=Yoonia tamlensis TaxID=390270 RepID=UPI0013F4DB9A|nr:TylF/MycF/NovP-related O-methyltransferase [Yoonia tamlensis]